MFLNASTLKVLGSSDSYNKNDKFIESNNSIVWTQDKKRWLATQPSNKIVLSEYENGYLLINNNKKSYKEENYNKNYYSLKEGWNYLSTPEDGVDILRTFQDIKSVIFVYVYDQPTSAWAGFSSDLSIVQEMLNTRILALKYIENNTGFYVYASQNEKVKIFSNKINKQCLKPISEGYKYIIASGKDKKMVYDDEKTIGIASRYASHYRRGIYNDSRVALIYKEMKSQNKEFSNYGTVKPKILLEYKKEREDSYFLIYDFLFKECYLGAFPSDKVPPFSSLKKIK